MADLQSALFTEAGQRVKVVEDGVKSLEHRFVTNTQFTLAALAVIPAILATMLPFPGAATITSSIWGPIAIGFSTFAFVSAFLRWRSNGSQRSSNAVWYAGAVAVLLAAIVFYFTYTFNVRYVERIATGRSSEEIVGAEFERIREDISELTGDLRLETREVQSALEELKSRVDELESGAVQPNPEQAREPAEEGTEGGPAQ